MCGYALSHVYSGRGFYDQIGGMIGTWMVANVAHVIIPSPRKLVEAKQARVAPDPVHGLRGKQRSVHTNYFTLPVLFIMISNHDPMTFGHPHAWLVLIAILLLAGFVRQFFNLRHRGRTAWWIPATAAVGAPLVAFAIAPRTAPGSTATELQAVTMRAMPIGNLTGMTDGERQVLGAWIAAGAPRK